MDDEQSIQWATALHELADELLDNGLRNSDNDKLANGNFLYFAAVNLLDPNTPIG